MAGSKLYGKGPSIVPDKKGGVPEGSGAPKAAAKEASKTAAAPPKPAEVKQDAPSGAQPKADLMAGTDGIPVHAMHATDRADLHGRHMLDHKDLQGRHERDHLARSLGHGAEDHPAMASRHNEERRVMHTRHEQEFRQMNTRHAAMPKKDVGTSGTSGTNPK